VTITARDRLRENCHTVTEKIRALDRTRFGSGPLAVVTDEEVAELEQKLRGVLGMI
jgi:mRNA interferase MazF